MRTNWRSIVALVVLITTAVSSISVKYEKSDSGGQLNVFCNSSSSGESSEGGHSEQLDHGDHNGDVFALQNATEIRFDRRCSIPFVPIQFLQELTLVEKVWLNNSGVQSIASLLNSNLKVLMMNDNNLFELPKYLFVASQQVEKVNFSNNSISKIDPDVFANLKHVKEINLSFNKIQSLGAGLFKGSNVLQFIYLSHNALVDFKPNLSNLTELQYLSLEGNRLTQLGCTVFPISGGNPTTIDASNNQLKSIDLNCDRKHNSSYLSLNVSDNQLEMLRFPNSTLAKSVKALSAKRNKIELISIANDLPGLKELDLANNNCVNVSDIVKHLGSLEVLDLSFNNIPEIRAIGNFTKLNALRLNNNNLTQIDNGTYSQSQNLSILDLSRNQLVGMFLPRFDALTFLNLNDNNLKEITGQPTFHKINQLGLSNNHFNCSFLGSFLHLINISEVHFIPTVTKNETTNIHGINCVADAKHLPGEHVLKANTPDLISICVISVCIALLLLAMVIITIKTRVSSNVDGLV